MLQLLELTLNVITNSLNPSVPSPVELMATNSKVGAGGLPAQLEEEKSRDEVSKFAGEQA